MTEKEANKRLEENIPKYFNSSFFNEGKEKVVHYAAVVKNPENSSDFLIEVGIKGLPVNQIHNIFSDQKTRSQEAIALENYISNIDNGKQGFSDKNLIIVASPGDIIELSENKIRKCIASNGAISEGTKISGTHTIKKGTAGAFFKVGDDKATYMITNAHIFSKRDEKVCASINGGNVGIGKIVKRIYCNDLSLDVAIVKISSTIDVKKSSTCISGKSFKDIEEPKIGMCVSKFGATTGLQKGIIRSVNCIINKNNNLGELDIYKNQIMTTDLSDEGDSGSVLVNECCNIVGLLHAGHSGSNTSYHSNIIRIFKTLYPDNYKNICLI